jgi:hypothetical protein
VRLQMVCRAMKLPRFPHPKCSKCS